MYFVDIVVSYDFFVLYAANYYFFSLSILYCLPLMLVNKVDQKKLNFQNGIVIIHTRVIHTHSQSQ